MKRMISLLLSVVLTLSLAIPAFADDFSCTDTSYEYTMCGKEMQITEHHCKNGDNTIRVESKDGVCISSFDADTRVITVELQAEGETAIFTLPPLDSNLPSEEQTVKTENDDIDPNVSGTYTATSAYWNFSCYFNTSRISTAGTFWKLDVPSETTHAAYDYNDSTAHGYANSFLDKLHSMNANISQADTAMRNAGEGNLISYVASALGAHFMVLGGSVVPVGAIIMAETVTSLIRNVGAGLDSNFYWYEACQYAKEAHVEFEAFRAVTESQTESIPLDIV